MTKSINQIIQEAADRGNSREMYYGGTRVTQDSLCPSSLAFVLHSDYKGSFLDRGVESVSVRGRTWSDVWEEEMSSAIEVYKERYKYTPEQLAQYKYKHKNDLINGVSCRPLPYPEPYWVTAERLSQSKNTDLTQFDVIEPYEKDKTE